MGEVFADADEVGMGWRLAFSSLQKTTGLGDLKVGLDMNNVAIGEKSHFITWGSLDDCTKFPGIFPLTGSLPIEQLCIIQWDHLVTWWRFLWCHASLWNSLGCMPESTCRKVVNQWGEGPSGQEKGLDNTSTRSNFSKQQQKLLPRSSPEAWSPRLYILLSLNTGPSKAARLSVFLGE